MSTRTSRRRRWTKGTPPAEGSAGAQRSKRRAPSGRINALRKQNGRFVKMPILFKCAGKPLPMTTMRNETLVNDTEAFTHTTNPSSSSLPTPTDRNIDDDTSLNAFTMPLPSEIVNEIFNHSILPHLKTDSSSEMQMLVCKNIFMKHYRSQLLNLLTSMIHYSRSYSCTYKNIESIVCASMRSLGFNMLSSLDLSFRLFSISILCTRSVYCSAL